MSDNQYNNNNWWPNSFFHQYMQQHAAMMHWIQSLHSNVNMQGVYDVNQTCQDSLHCPRTVHYDCNPAEYNASSESTSSSENSSPSGTSSSSNSGRKEHEIDEEDESEYEFELNVDAILAMRQAKEDLKKEASSDSSSIIMVDRGEDFEFVELGSTQQTEAKRSVLVGGVRDRNAELKYEKELKEHLYGEKFTTIAGLETAMALTYERLCDIHQPPVWPVYPLRMTS